MSEYNKGDRVIALKPGYPIGETEELQITKVVMNGHGGDYYYRAGKRTLMESEIIGHAQRPIPDEPNERAKILEESEALINGDRAKDYGDPATNFGRLAKLWAPILGVDITPAQVALCLTQLKISRLINTPNHRDSFIDAAGYIALGAELAQEATK